MKYIILANYTNKKYFSTPKHLIEINGEPIIGRTIRLLKENGIEDIIISSSNEMLDRFGVKRHVPINNHYDGTPESGYWLDAFPIEILDEPTTYLFGDMYYTEDAIKTIINTEVKESTLFCQFENKNNKYIKEWDEPLAYKVINIEEFKYHLDKVKKMRDSHWREPLIWELYRSINGQDIRIHEMTKNYIAINDESTDIDFQEEIEKIKSVIEK